MLIEEIIGKIFKNRRKELKCKIDSLVDGICDRRTYYTIEDGDKRMNFIFFMDLASSLGFSLDEIALRAFDYQLSPNQEFMRKALNYYFTKNIVSLKELYQARSAEKDLDNADHAHLLMAAALIHDMDPEFKILQKMVEKVAEYFFTLSYWGNNEIILFGSSSDVLPFKIMRQTMREIIKNKETLCFEERGKRNFLILLINVSYRCLRENDLAGAAKFFSEIETVLATQRNEENIYPRFLFRFMKGYYFLLDGKKEIGLKTMDHAIAVFTINECFEVVEKLRTYYNEALKQVR
jgi:Rgg/GadR/MutR family transcriptional activator